MPARSPQSPLFGALVERRWILWPMVVGLLGLFFWVGYALFAERPLAELTDTSDGTARDHRASVGRWLTAHPGDEFFDGDGARTSAGGGARFSLFSGARLELKPSSQVRFLRRGGQGAIGLSVDVGEVDVLTRDGVLTLDAAFGEIVIEKNSTITLRRNGQRLAVNVELGGIEFTGKSYGAGQAFEIEFGGIVIDSRETSKGDPKGPDSDERSLERGDGIDYADLVAPAGQTFTVHDPSPPTAIGFVAPTACKDGARLVVGKAKTEGRRQMNLLLGTGRHRYALRCLEAPDKPVLEGTFVIVHDAGIRPLPTFTPTANVAADGRRYTVLFQDKLPRVTVSWPSAPAASAFELVVDGRVIRTKESSYTFGTLAPGTHKIEFRADTTPPRVSRPTTVVVEYDRQAATAQVTEPRSGSFEAGQAVPLRGQALAGWSVSLDGAPVPLDSRGRFSLELKAKQSIPLVFSHPTQGLHYYLRRARSR